MNATRPFLGNLAGWTDAQIHLAALQGLWGGWRIFVFGSLDAIVQRVTPARREQRYRLALTEAEFQAVLDACIENDLLSIPKPQRPGHPDETMLQLTLVSPAGESRLVEKWAGDELERFDIVFRRIFSLADRTKNMLPFYTGPFDWSVSPLSPPPDQAGKRNP